MIVCITAQPLVLLIFVLLPLQAGDSDATLALDLDSIIVLDAGNLNISHQDIDELLLLVFIPPLAVEHSLPQIARIMFSSCHLRLTSGRGLRLGSFAGYSASILRMSFDGDICV